MKKSKSKEAVSIGSSTIQEKNPGTVPKEEDLETGDVLTQAPTTSMESSPARPRTQQQKAGIIFPVLRIKKYLKNGKLTNNLQLVFPAIVFRKLQGQQHHEDRHPHLPGCCAGVSHC